MVAKLLIRVYDVGLGDCIFCRIPDAIETGGKTADFHMLIDCGSWSGMDGLKKALDDLATILPDAGEGQKRLDLLVVTHEHKDHISGCDPELFKRFKIGAIWMNAAMNENHKQAQNTRHLHAFASKAMTALQAQGLAFGPELEDLADVLGIGNPEAMKALREGLPKANGIEPTYVHAGQGPREHGVTLKGAEIHVLGPEDDIDGVYLGKKPATAVNALAMGEFGAAVAAAPAPAPPAEFPTNIGAAEFRRLRSRMLSSGLAFAALSGQVANNSSVVLLIEWRGRRLLFVGDAEWDAGYKPGKANASWNVMWNMRKAKLAGPIDFLKIGHHGSENATPWDFGRPGQFKEPADILDSILPPPADGQERGCYAVVSTQRQRYETIPRGALLNTIGARVCNARNYDTLFGKAGLDQTKLPKFDGFESQFFAAPQPQRTDLESQLTGLHYVDVELQPKP